MTTSQNKVPTGTKLYLVSGKLDPLKIKKDERRYLIDQVADLEKERSFDDFLQALTGEIIAAVRLASPTFFSPAGTKRRYPSGERRFIQYLQSSYLDTIGEFDPVGRHYKWVSAGLQSSYNKLADKIRPTF